MTSAHQGDLVLDALGQLGTRIDCAGSGRLDLEGPQVLWLVVSTGFALYVANFGSYNKTYGTLAAVVVFLIWLWLSNMALLSGAELDAELMRERRVAQGQPADREPYAVPRDPPKTD